jgi:hypothetical protein
VEDEVLLRNVDGWFVHAKSGRFLMFMISDRCGGSYRSANLKTLQRDDLIVMERSWKYHGETDGVFSRNRARVRLASPDLMLFGQSGVQHGTGNVAPDWISARR